MKNELRGYSKDNCCLDNYLYELKKLLGCKELSPVEERIAKRCYGDGDDVIFAYREIRYGD